MHSVWKKGGIHYYLLKEYWSSGCCCSTCTFITFFQDTEGHVKVNLHSEWPVPSPHSHYLDQISQSPSSIPCHHLQGGLFMWVPHTSCSKYQWHQYQYPFRASPHPEHIKWGLISKLLYWGDSHDSSYKQVGFNLFSVEVCRIHDVLTLHEHVIDGWNGNSCRIGPCTHSEFALFAPQGVGRTLK